MSNPTLESTKPSEPTTHEATPDEIYDAALYKDALCDTWLVQVYEAFSDEGYHSKHLPKHRVTPFSSDSVSQDEAVASADFCWGFGPTKQAIRVDARMVSLHDAISRDERLLTPYLLILELVDSLMAGERVKGVAGLALVLLSAAATVGRGFFPEMGPFADVATRVALGAGALWGAYIALGAYMELSLGVHAKAGELLLKMEAASRPKY